MAQGKLDRRGAPGRVDRNHAIGLELIRHHQPLPAGTFGAKLLVTVLYNHTPPLIRYKLDDSLRLAPQPCPCGRPYPLAQSVQGRTQDVLHLPRDGGGQVAVHPLVFHQVMDQTPTAGWQVVNEPGRLRLLVVAPGASFNQDLVRTTLTAELRRLRVQEPAVVVERTDSIPVRPTARCGSSSQHAPPPTPSRSRATPEDATGAA